MEPLAGVVSMLDDRVAAVRAQGLAILAQAPELPWEARRLIRVRDDDPVPELRAMAALAHAKHSGEELDTETLHALTWQLTQPQSNPDMERLCREHWSLLTQDGVRAAGSRYLFFSVHEPFEACALRGVRAAFEPKGEREDRTRAGAENFLRFAQGVVRCDRRGERPGSGAPAAVEYALVRGGSGKRF